jgi:multiple sugar transport system permease protein
MSTSTTSAPPGAARPPVAGRSGHRKSLQRPEKIAAYLFVTPFFLIFLAMVVTPLVYSGYLSFFREQLIGGDAFVGFENYADALQDSRS